MAVVAVVLVLCGALGVQLALEEGGALLDEGLELDVRDVREGEGEDGAGLRGDEGEVAVEEDRVEDALGVSRSSALGPTCGFAGGFVLEVVVVCGSTEGPGSRLRERLTFNNLPHGPRVRKGLEYKLGGPALLHGSSRDLRQVRHDVVQLPVRARLGHPRSQVSSGGKPTRGRGDSKALQTKPI